MAQNYRYTGAGGGLDLVTPAIEQLPGGLIGGDNYEVLADGYRRIEGYERLDGQQKPSTASYWYLNFDAGDTEISEDDTVTGANSGATGIALIDAVVESGSYAGNDAVGYIILTNVSGTFTDDDPLQVSAVTKVTLNGTAAERGASNDTDDTTWLRDAMETARTAILIVPGSGTMRGVCTLAGVSYAFRDNAGGTAVDVYKSTASGWSQVPLGFKLAFTSGGTYEVAEGDTITGASSSRTATVTRVALQSGSWAAGTAAGYIIYLTASGEFQAENLNVGAESNVATIAADGVAITLAPGGRFEFKIHNFGGHAGANRIYGADGVSMGFEFDGTVMVPIKTGMTTDTPAHVEVHKQQLFFTFTGGSVQNSGIGLPYAWTVITGAAEMALGQEVTGLLSDVEGFMVVGGRSTISILQGQDVDNFELVPWSNESGVIEWSMQLMGSPMFVDNIGLRNLTAARDYGNFNIGTLSRKVEPIFKSKKKAGVTLLASMRVRDKDTYLLFWSDMTGTSFYLGLNPKKPESLSFTLPVAVHCTWSGEDANGDEILLFGSTDGYVYEKDAGANHDGAEVVGFVRFPFNHVNSPTRNKQWFKATLEVDASPTVELGVTAEYGYADSEQPPAIQIDFTVTGGGGFWNEDLWNDFFWSSPVEGLAQAPLDGLGTNCSIAAASTGTYDDPHTIHGLTLHYSMRGLVR